ncbi:hypothetical protein PMI22_00606 [Pseudomonas sp. GM21]|jgi:hypothetical protein|nr:hypothetical protein PMI22_00606 [Pseudomonas sp. GM21]
MASNDDALASNDETHGYRRAGSLNNHWEVK